MGAKTPDKIDVEVRKRIRTIRQEAGLTRTHLADGLGVTFQQIQKYEKGVNRMGAGRLTKAAHLFKVPVGTLFSDAPAAKEEIKRSEEFAALALGQAGSTRPPWAYARLEDGKFRQAVMTLIEEVVAQPSKKRNHS